MTDPDTTDRLEMILQPFPPLPPGHVAEQQHARAVELARCEDCNGTVQMDANDPAAWRVIHDPTCPRLAELRRRRRVQRDAEEREAARTERLARRRKRQR